MTNIVPAQKYILLVSQIQGRTFVHLCHAVLLITKLSDAGSCGRLQKCKRSGRNSNSKDHTFTRRDRGDAFENRRTANSSPKNDDSRHGKVHKIECVFFKK